MKKKFPELRKFKPRNPKKYKGDYKNIIARSSWETKFMLWADKTDSVIWWASEEISIPYINPIDKKIHKYYPDFIIAVKSNDVVETYLIEVKPKRETKPPINKGNKKTKTFITEQTTFNINQEKWKSAIEYCKKMSWKFKIITEETLF